VTVCHRRQSRTIRNWIAAGRLSAETSAGTFRIAQDYLDALRTNGTWNTRAAESASVEVRADVGPQGAERSAPSAGLVELVLLVRDLQEQLITRTEAAAM
jgi:hypothetical protein